MPPRTFKHTSLYNYFQKQLRMTPHCSRSAHQRSHWSDACVVVAKVEQRNDVTDTALDTRTIRPLLFTDVFMRFVCKITTVYLLFYISRHIALLHRMQNRLDKKFTSRLRESFHVSCFSCNKVYVSS